MERNNERGLIINYLTLQFMREAGDSYNASTKVRTAYIKALKKYYKMSAIEKQNIINKIKE
tara:strand:- start:58 stop:240 length:183 start_codon:yes stop_codon:yes gene_type:complete